MADDIFGSLPPVQSSVAHTVAAPNPFDDPHSAAATASAAAPAANAGASMFVDPFDAPPERAAAHTIVAAPAPDPRSSNAVAHDPYVMGFSQPQTHSDAAAAAPAAHDAAAAAVAAGAAAVEAGAAAVAVTASAAADMAAAVAAATAPVAAAAPAAAAQPPAPTAAAPETKQKPATHAAKRPSSMYGGSASAAYAAAAGVAPPGVVSNTPQSAHSVQPQQHDDDADAAAAAGLLGGASKRPAFSFRDGDNSKAGGAAAPTNLPSAKTSVVGTLFGDAKTNKVYESIKVGDPELRGSNALTHYHVYKVVTTPNPGVDAVWRRYRDFDWLRAALVKWFPGVFVPPLPPKKMMGSTEAEFVKERKIDIERFLWRCAQVPALALSDPFTAFVSKAQNFDDAMKELDKQCDSRGTEELIRAYKQLFPAQMSFALAAQSTVDAELKGLLEWLTVAEKKMSETLDLALNFDKTYGEHVKHLQTLQTLLHQVDSSEKAFRQRPDPPRLDVLENFTQWVEQSKQLAPSYNRDLVTGFKHELQDVQVFIDLLKARDAVAKSAAKAAATAKKWKQPDAPPTTTDKLQKQKETELKAEENYAAQLEAMTKLILSEQIKKFWLEKTVQFRRSMAALAKTHSVVHHHMTQIWETLYEEATAPSL